MTSAAADPLVELGQLEGVPSAVAAAMAAVDVVLRDRGFRTVSARDVAAAELAAAHSGVRLAREAGASASATDPADEVVATVRMLGEVRAGAALVGTAPGQLLARLHAVWGRGLLAEEDLGRPEATDQVGQRLAGLQQLLTSTRADAVVVAGVAHAELWSVAPFAGGSWAVALGCQQAILAQRGVDPYGVLPVAAGHESIGGHGEALAGYRSGTAAGMRQWLLHCASALARAAELSPVAGRGAKLPRQRG